VLDVDLYSLPRADFLNILILVLKDTKEVLEEHSSQNDVTWIFDLSREVDDCDPARPRFQVLRKEGQRHPQVVSVCSLKGDHERVLIEVRVLVTTVRQLASAIIWRWALRILICKVWHQLLVLGVEVWREAHSLEVEGPRHWGQTCEVLEVLGGGASIRRSVNFTEAELADVVGVHVGLIVSGHLDLCVVQVEFWLSTWAKSHFRSLLTWLNRGYSLYWSVS